MSEIVNFDEKYAQWIKNISSRFKQSQIKAACRFNVELLEFYWSLGRDISIREKENAYGTDFFRKLSADLCDAIPEVKSFSETNLRYMKRFYELYPSAINLPQVVADSEQRICCIPWGHNRMIIDKCKNDHDKAIFFVKQTIESNWSRAVLLNFLETDLY